MTLSALKNNLAASPHSHAALQRLVMAMADAENSRGKKSFFGKDLSEAAYQKAFEGLRNLLAAMHQDHIIKSEHAPDQVLVLVQSLMLAFAKAYPNWSDAYRFGDRFLFGEDLSLANEIINNYQSIQNRLDGVVIIRSKV